MNKRVCTWRILIKFKSILHTIYSLKLIYYNLILKFENNYLYKLFINQKHLK